MWGTSLDSPEPGNRTSSASRAAARPGRGEEHVPSDGSSCPGGVSLLVGSVTSSGILPQGGSKPPISSPEVGLFMWRERTRMRATLLAGVTLAVAAVLVVLRQLGPGPRAGVGGAARRRPRCRRRPGPGPEPAGPPGRVRGRLRGRLDRVRRPRGLPARHRRRAGRRRRPGHPALRRHHRRHHEPAPAVEHPARHRRARRRLRVHLRRRTARAALHLAEHRDHPAAQRGGRLPGRGPGRARRSHRHPPLHPPLRPPRPTSRTPPPRRTTPGSTTS